MITNKELFIDKWSYSDHNSDTDKIKFTIELNRIIKEEIEKEFNRRDCE